MTGEGNLKRLVPKTSREGILSLKVLLPLYSMIINLIDDSSEDIDVMMILNRRKMTRAVIVACIEHYCSTHTDVLSYCYH